MRNLKRVLSLALAAMMLLSVMVITSSAAEITKADFSDMDEITYKEAVEVMVALDVIDGMDDGTFDPSGILTREQAAKLLCYMLLGPENAENLTTNSSVFVDVEPGRWSAGYISYCSNVGILAGMGDGTFLPAEQLTGVAFGKMLLVALGYDPAVEHYVNDANWATNIAADMVNSGIAVNGVVLSNPLSREAAAQMAFQTLTADMVHYTSKPITINNTDGSSVVIAAGEAAPTTGDGTGTNYAGTATNDTGKGYLQFCEKYFPRLKLVNTGAAAHDSYGRPGAMWQYYGQNVTFKPDEAVLTYTDTVTTANAKKALGSYTYTAGDVAPVTDGTPALAACADVDALAAAINAAAGKGVTVTVYVDDTNTITDVAVINTYIGKVSKVATNNGETTVTVSRLNGGPSTATTFKSTAFAKDDYVLYTVGEVDGEIAIESMALAEELTGEITATSSNYLRLDGTRYNHAKNINSENGINIGDASIYLDASGNVMYVGEVKSAEAQYLFVKGSDKYFETISIRAVFADGTTQVVVVSGDTLIDNTSSLMVANSGTKLSDNTMASHLDAIASNMKNKVFAYTVSNDEYKLTTSSLIVTPSATHDELRIEQGRTALYDDFTTSGSAHSYYTDVTASNNTTYVMTSNGQTYTGYRNVPSLEAVSMVYVKNENDNRVADLVFILNSTDAGDENSFYFYVAKTTDYETIKEGNNTYTSWKAYVNGVEQTVVTNNGLVTGAGLYRAGTVNGSGYVTALHETNGKVIKTDMSLSQAEYANNGNLTIYGGGTYSYDDSTVFVYVGTNNSVSVGSVSDIITRDPSAALGSDITYVYVAETKGNNGVNATAAKTVYIIAASKDTPAESVVDTSNFDNAAAPTVDELNAALTSATTPVVTLPTTVKVPSGATVPAGKTLVVTDENIGSNTLNIASGNVDATGADLSSVDVTAGAGATVEISSMPNSFAGTGAIEVADDIGNGGVEADLDDLADKLGLSSGETGTTNEGVTTFTTTGAGLDFSGGQVKDWSDQYSMDQWARAMNSTSVTFHMFSLTCSGSGTVVAEFTTDGETWNVMPDGFGSQAGGRPVESTTYDIIVPVGNNVTAVRYTFTANSPQ